MQRFDPINADRSDPESRDILNIVGGARTDWPNFVRVLAHSPSALEAYLAAERALQDGALSSRQRALIALAVAEINGSAYGLSSHHAAALAAGLTEDEIRGARRGIATDPKAHALLRFTAVVTLQRGEVSDEELQGIAQSGFREREIADIVACIALCIFADYFNKVARTAIDFPLLQPGSDQPGPSRGTIPPAATPAAGRQ